MRYIGPKANCLFFYRQFPLGETVSGSGTDSVAGIPMEWLPFAAFWLLFLAIALVELLRPIHHKTIEAKGRLFTNFSLGVATFAIVTFLPLSIILAAQWAANESIGLLNLVAMPAALVFALTIILRSLAAYALHRLDHKVPLLWRLHQIHHSDTAIDLSTSFRNHPVTPLFQAAIMASVAVLLGLSVPALIAYELISTGLVLLTHANLHLGRAEPWLRWLIVTPQMHHVHHSAARHETDSNFGDVFSVWDRLLGTYCARSVEEVRTMRLGLGDSHDPDAGSLIHQLKLPLLGTSTTAAAAAPPPRSARAERAG
jgi:sterol desaturase/sphingolipid hydroxylase (fatty acid hydroxylase superfamily)